MIGVNDPQPGTKGVEAQFLLCETALHEMKLTFTPLQPVPIGSSGLGVTLLGGTVLIGPDSTRITLDINFESYPNKGLLSDGQGTVTLDTAGLLKLDASGKLVANFDANFSLAVAWDPLDLLLQGDVKYKSSGLLTGYLYLHAWRGAGWQNKYPWITDDKIHFTGTIGGKLRIPKGELIDGPGPLDIPPTTLSLGADISFGEFCRSKNPCEAPYPWGVAATVSVLGYKAGVYIDKDGPEIILGTQGKVLIDQAGGANRWSSSATSITPQGAFNYAQQLPGAVQDNLVPDWGNSFDDVVPQSGNFTDATNGVNCQYGNGQTTYVCDFTLGASGRGLWTVAWTAGTPTLSLKNPNGQISTLNNQAPGVSVSEINEDGIRYVVFTAVSAPPNNLNGTWQLKLDNLLTGNDGNNFSIAFAADPPVPELNVLTPAVSPTAAGETFLIEWETDFGGAAVPSGDILELIYAPVFAAEPLPLDPITVAFPSEYLEEAGVDVTAVSDTNGDAVWVYEPEDTVAGDFTYMALINSTQEEQYGQNGVRNGEPIPITIQSDGQAARFYYDRRDNYVTSSLEDDIVVLVGNMMSEVGGADWTADNLTGWMKPTETGYEIILNLPAGNWQYKVALNESMVENYGQGGVLNGANIQLNVPVDGTAIRFHYDPNTHIISHETAADTPGITISYTQAINNSYLWHTAGLATGEYIVGARLNDIQRGNSIITAWAPGTVWIEDLTPPPNPVPESALHVDGMIKVRWQPDTETPDLAGYQIEYEIPDVTLNPANAIQRIRRVLPSDRHGLYEESLLISDNSYPNSVCIRAFDASGNLSSCVTVPYVGISIKPLPAAEQFEAISDGSEMILSWYYPFETNGYIIRYGLAGCYVEDAVTIADEGASPLFVNIGITELLVTGLTPNQLYWFEVRPLDQWGIEGFPLRTTAMLIDAHDGNGDNVADEWAAFYNLPAFVPLTTDSDFDGLTDREEYVHLSNPHHADSDGDGHYDGNEAATGAAVCNPNSHPTSFTQPKLTLMGNQVNKLILDKTQNGTVGSFDVVNFGSDEMVWTVESSANWLSVNSWTGIQIDGLTGKGDATLFYDVDSTNLSPGFYTAEITITSIDGPNSVGFVSETAVLQFELTVIPAPTNSEYQIFLPFVLK